MKQVLLAIDGNVPSRLIFKYAADLCKHISARLCILQFIKNRKDRSLSTDYATSSNNTDGIIGNIETGGRDIPGQKEKRLAGISGPLKKMLKNLNCPVPYSVALSAGSPENVLSGYVDSHHNIVLAVFDPSHDREPAFSRIKELKQTWCSPGGCRPHQIQIKYLDRLLQNANFPNFFVGKINLILRILYVCLRSN